MEKELPPTMEDVDAEVSGAHFQRDRRSSIRLFKKEEQGGLQRRFVEEQIEGLTIDDKETFSHRKRRESINEVSTVQQGCSCVAYSDEVIRAGFILKETDSFIKHWNNCYCLLTPKKLLCFEDDSRTKLISCLNFKKVDCQIQKLDDSGTIFSLICGDQQIGHTFKTGSLLESERWLEDISDVIRSFLSHPKLKLRKGSQELYHNDDTLIEEEFFETAESGDILLMKTSDSKCALQRLVTNSQYDHISMVVKFPNGLVKIFEANADEGVQVYDWEAFNRRFTHFEKICYRKLYHPKKEEFHGMLVSFMKQMIGKEYSFGAMKLLRRSSSEEGSEVQSDFFCSELIAKAYKYFGILNKKKASNSYWPVDFTDRGGLVLDGEGYFGFEKLIILKRHLKGF